MYAYMYPWNISHREEAVIDIVGPISFEVYNSFKWTEDDDKKKLYKIADKFKNYCNTKKNITT